MPSVTYSSTRGGEKNLDFRTVVMQGLAKDRGLFVPDTIPTITPADLQQWRDLSYAEVAVQVIGKFVQDDQVPTSVLRDIVTKSCAAFASPDVTPLVAVHGHSILVRFAVWFAFIRRRSGLCVRV
jgi:threonine synthase